MTIAGNFGNSPVPAARRGRELVGRASRAEAESERVVQELDWNSTQTETLAGVLHYVLSFCQRQRWLLALGVLLGCVFMPLAVKLAAPRFTAATTILFDTGKVQIFAQPSMVELNEGLEDQIQIIKSEMIARRVLSDLSHYADAEFPVPEQGRVEKLLGSSIASMLGLGAPRTAAWREHFRLAAFQESLTVTRVPQTRAIILAFQSSTAARASDFVNSVASNYLSLQSEEKRQLNRRAASWLKERLDELKLQAAETQRAVNQFRASNSLLETGLQLVERRFNDLNRDLTVERTRVSELNAKINRIDNVIRDYDSAEIKPAVSELMGNSLVSKLREQLYDLSNRRANWLKRYRADHQAILQVDERIKEIHVALLNEHQRLAATYHSDIEIATRKEALIEASLKEVVVEMEATNKARIKLRELESASQATQALYEGLLKRHSEAMEQDAFPIARARVLDQATEPLGKNYKKTFKVALVLLFAGFGVGLSAAVFRELSDQTFRGLREVEQVLGVPLLTVVSTWNRRDGTAARKAARRAPAQIEQAAPGIKRGTGVIWVSADLPQSQFAESLRMLQHNVDQHFNSHDCRVIGVTSTQPGEGASTLAATFAVALASSGRRSTLLIDCDLRNPSLSRLLAPDAKLGLVDVLTGKAAVADVVRKDAATGLSFLPVPTSRGYPAEELLNSEALDRLIAAARAQYDYVIVDLPSLVPMVDVLMTTRFVDGYISVVAWGASEKEATRRAYERSSHFRDRLLGVVLNKVDMKRLRYYDHEAAQWFNTKLYKHYFDLRAA